jgi:hypothetical protein
MKPPTNPMTIGEDGLCAGEWPADTIRGKCAKANEKKSRPKNGDTKVRIECIDSVHIIAASGRQEKQG